MEDRPLDLGLRVTDRWFRAWGVATLVLLAATGAMLAFDAGHWRLPFALAHLAALLALLPLGLVLVARALIEARPAGKSWFAAAGEAARRHMLVTALVALALVTVSLSLANFPDGDRAVRTLANLSTVVIVGALVVRYLRSRPVR
jgi:hypothetical protein